MPTLDLSHSVSEDATVYPGDPAVELAPAATREADGYRVTEVQFGSHSGTHVDAPSHTEPDGRPIDAFEPAAFVFDARIVDCSSATAREPIERSALPEETDAELLVVRTDWDAHWGTDRYYDHPFLTPAAAEWCGANGHHVGLDALSPDPSPSRRGDERDDEPGGVPAHHALLGRERFVIENLTGLAELPERVELRAYPLALDGGDGSPVRAVAVW